MKSFKEEIQKDQNNLTPPNGWKYFTDKILNQEKEKILKQAGVNRTERQKFFYSEPTSMNVKSILKKINASRELARFLMYQNPESKKINFRDVIKNQAKGKFF